jgi:uncharacterized membrane protein YGL010W
MRDLQSWLDDYGDSHRNAVNKRLHWVCVPVIVWCVIGALWCIPRPAPLAALPAAVNWATVTLVATLLYYSRLSLRLAAGALAVFALMSWPVARRAAAGTPQLLGICAALFALAWVGQFIGHAIEGRRPSFLKDLQFLLIGPLWLLADLYRRLGWRYD